jgi:hypothetical protein
MTSLSASKFDTRARNPQGSWLGIGRPHSVWNNAQGSTIGGPVDREIATIKSEEGVDSFAFGEVHQGGVGYLERNFKVFGQVDRHREGTPQI